MRTTLDRVLPLVETKLGNCTTEKFRPESVDFELCLAGPSFGVFA